MKFFSFLGQSHQICQVPLLLLVLKMSKQKYHVGAVLLLIAEEPGSFWMCDRGAEHKEHLENRLKEKTCLELGVRLLLNGAEGFAWECDERVKVRGSGVVEHDLLEMVLLELDMNYRCF